MEVVLKISDGANIGQSYKLNEDIINIGRSKKNHIAIEDKAVSGFHSTITFKDGKFVITDHSKNGTFINGKKIKETILNSGDEIRVGQTTLQFVLESNIGEKEIVPEKLDETQRRRISAESLIEEKTRVKERDELPQIEKTAKSKKKIKPIMIVVPAALIILGVIYIMSSPEKSDKSPSPEPTPDVNQTEKFEIVDIAEAYKKLDINGLDDDIKNKIKNGKERYDGKKRQPGNLYKAIKFWKEALVMLDGETGKLLENIVYTAECELKAKIDTLWKDAKNLDKSEDKKGAAAKLKLITEMIPNSEDTEHKKAKRYLIEGNYQKYLGE